MQLSKELLEKYKDGQLVSTIEDTGTLQRAQIKEIQFHEGVINVKFEWRAENTGTPSDPTYVWEGIESNDLVIEARLFDISLLNDDNRPTPLDFCLDPFLETGSLKPLFFWSSSLNMRIIFMPQGDETQLIKTDVAWEELSYAICRARGERNGDERLICCLNSASLPEFDEKNVVLQVKKKTSWRELPELKQELRALATEAGLIDEQGRTSVVNLEDKNLQPSVRG